MTWKYIGDGRFISGVPARDLTDEEMAAADAAFDGALSACQHPEEEREDGHACLLYERVDDRPARAERPAARRPSPGGDE